MASSSVTSCANSRRVSTRASESMNSNSRGRQNRRLTCRNCRARKTRCDGTQPGCKTCEVYRVDCHYDRPPPMTHILEMSKRLRECEELIKELTEAPPSVSVKLHDALIASQLTTDGPMRDQACEAHVSSHLGPHLTANLVESRIPRSDLSLNERGELCYHGPTSAVHDPPTIKDRSQHGAPVQSHELSEEHIRTSLVSKAIQSRDWEDLAIGNAAIEVGLPKSVLWELLQLHWSWIAPMFMWVYRPAFMRDMATGGPYYSQFLLIVLCAHSSRFQADSIGAMLITRARLLLGNEIQKPSSIPAVQALLQLSARELAFGSISQAWLYSGMAFRMVSDLGLHHISGDMFDLTQHSARDLEIRRRLFWSCYFWDKAISLYLGRMPTLTELPFDHAPVLFDHLTEHEPWVPYYDTYSDTGRAIDNNYPSMKSHAISCFENSCKLAVILSDIILELYCRSYNTNTESSLQEIRERLDQWRSTSPQHLVCDPNNLPEVCPPPHIVTQNLLYFTTIILLHRPFYSSAVHHKACCDASDSIEKLLVMIEQTFGFTHITYLMAYCIYTAASVRVRNINAGMLGVGTTLDTFLRALKGGCVTCPVVQRSLDIINNSLNKSIQLQEKSTEASIATFKDTFLPAFPSYNTPPILDDSFDFNRIDSTNFFSLDFFPENNIDSSVDGWYIPDP